VKVVYEDGKFKCFSSYDEKHLPKSAGWWWDSANKYWFTKEKHKALLLKDYFTPSASSEANRCFQPQPQCNSIAYNDKIPCPEGIRYFPFQEEGIRYSLSREGTLNASEMGCGKSIMALGLINIDETLRNILIICPASLKINWQRESEKWLVRPFEIYVINNNKISPNVNANLIIVNYDRLKGDILKYIMKRNWDLLIVDEAHALKNGAAQRTKKILGVPPTWRYHNGSWKQIKPRTFGVIDQCRKKVFLTGTPVLNRPVELFSLISALDSKNWRSRSKFETRYCNAHMGKWGWDNKGASNIDELNFKLRSSIMFRKTKAEVLPDLPPKTRQIIVLPGDSKVKSLIKEEKKLKIDFSDIEALTPVSTEFQQLSELRKRLAIAKLPMIIEHIENILEGTEKIVIFAHHHEVIDALHGHFQASVKLDGRNSLEAKQKAIDAFQDGQARIFIGSIQAAGVGITLTAASHAVFAESDWVPANLSQAEDRLNRIGQKNAVLIQHLVVDGTLDARMVQIVVEKQKIIDGIVKPVELIEPKKSEPPKSKPSKSKPGNGKKNNNITNERREALCCALISLAGKCDGARQQDGCGFNKLDTNFGTSLAKRGSERPLTDEEFLAALKMIKKYKRQIEPNLFDLIYKN